MAKENNMIRRIVEMKEENKKIEELINFLEMENFEYALKCNQIKNILANIRSITKNCPAKLLETSDNICNILQMCGGSQEDELLASNKSIAEKRVSVGKTPVSDKLPTAHVVKPHMVNGHILYIPTINLTRVSDLHTPSTSKSNSQRQENDFSSARPSTNDNTNCVPPQQPSSRFTENTAAEDDTNNTPENNEEFSNENQLSHIEEVAEPSTSSSKSPSHSTVLSGTFQEVKIYLNQISPDSLSEESRKLMKRSKSTSKSRKDRRSSFGCITKRKKS